MAKSGIAVQCAAEPGNLIELGRSEKAMAREARELARESVGEHVHLRNVELGKYAGRVIADVFTEDGRRLADVLIEARLARGYDGGERQGWCE
ncbi:MAG: hypothetical protein V3R30_03130 [Kiloniellales bacterium]